MIQLQEAKFEDLRLPSKLYKFRNWSIPEHRRIITHKEVYFAPFNSFNDHHEHNLPQDYDAITYQNKLDYFYKHAESVGGVYGHENKLKYAKWWADNSPMNSIRHRQEVEEKYLDKLNRTRGVLSLSPERDNRNLWSNFANGYRGFAIGLNPEFMFEKGVITCAAGMIDYYPQDNPPKIKVLCDNDVERIEQVMKTIFSLPDIFQDEKEYRLSKMTLTEDSRRYPIRGECVEEILLGAFMTPENEHEIIEHARANFPNSAILKQNINFENDEIGYENI